MNQLKKRKNATAIIVGAFGLLSCIIMAETGFTGQTGAAPADKVECARQAKIKWESELITCRQGRKTMEEIIQCENQANRFHITQLHKCLGFK